MVKSATPEERQAIQIARRRYYEALREGMTPQEATRFVNETSPDAKPVVKPAPAPVRPAPAPVQPKEVDTGPDDLTRINGIGSNTVKRLAGMGVTQFGHIAKWSDNEASNIDQQLGLRGRILREDWVGQAKNLAGR